MTRDEDEGGFLSRWSRLKRKHAEGPDPEPEPEPRDAEPERKDEVKPGETRAPVAAQPEAEPTKAPPAIDLSHLPAIESITAATDIRGFLAPGVPAELTQAALRRAWVVDPKIRDFIEIAENQWDFTKAGTMPGFGDLAGEDIARLVSEVIGDRKPLAERIALDEQKAANPEKIEKISAPATAPQTLAEVSSVGREPPALPDPATRPELVAQPGDNDAASQHRPTEEEWATQLDQRRHGRALPK